MFEASPKTKWKVGIFTLMGLFLMGYLSIYINNHPYWWRPCELVHITVEDATGIKMKTPVKSLGMDIGYVTTVSLVNQGVELQICVTAEVEVTSETRAYVRSEGFLGDKFVELKPVKIKNLENSSDHKSNQNHSRIHRAIPLRAIGVSFLVRVWSEVASAQAQSQKGKEIPVGEKSADVQQMVNQMNNLVNEVKQVTSSLKDSINPEEIRGAIKQLNKTLENAGSILAPEGNLSATARRSLLKLEDAIDQFRDQVTKINQGQGSLGRLLNDPVYAEEVKKALENLNRFLNKANDMRVMVQLGVEQLSGWNGSRGFFAVTIWPRSHRYYHLGLTTDPRGVITQTVTTTQVGPTVNTVTSTRIDRGGFGTTAMVGQVFAGRFDLSMGMLHGDGAVSALVNLGWGQNVEALQWKNDLYFRASTGTGSWVVQPDYRSHLILQPFSIVYLTAGIEGLRKINGSMPFLFGGGLRFEDEDIKLLFLFL